MKLIGLLGPAGTGKDTMADHLVAKYGFVKMSLADEMKRIAKRVYDFTDEQLWGPSECRNKPDERYPRKIVTKESTLLFENSVTAEYLSPRVALQILGTEFGRACYENTWINLTLKDANKVTSGSHRYQQQIGLMKLGEPRSVVIPDCRFHNEVDAIHKAGGIVIRLRRKTTADATKVGVQNHASETEQLSLPDELFDYVLEVPDGIPAYQNAIDNLLFADTINLLT